MISNNTSVNTYSAGSVSQYSYGPTQEEDSDNTAEKTEAKSEKETATEKNSNTGNPTELSGEEQKEVEKLKKRDAEVKAHEMAHMAAGGQYAGVASFEYQTAPNGVKYAVGGEVQIDVSEVSGDPQATITKMGIIQKAALAPAEPSAADRAVAASASMKEMEARGEVMQSATEPQKKGPDKLTGKTEYSNEENQSSKGETLDVII